MRLINRLSVMATVVSTIFLASCAGDVYDPSKEPQAPPAPPQAAAPPPLRQPRMALVGL